MNTKDGFNKKFLDRLKLIEQLYLMGSTVGLILGSTEGLKLISDKKIISEYTKEILYDLGPLAEMLKGTDNARIYLPEFNKFLSRFVIIALYEAFKDDDIRFEKIKNEDWFNFLWVLRNSFAHGIEGIWRHIKKDVIYTRKIDGQQILIKKDWNREFVTLDQVGGWLTFIDLIKKMHQ